MNSDTSCVSTSFDIKQDVLERFLRYVRIDTQSDVRSDSYPSTAKQLNLLNLLAEELRAMGVEDVRQDEYGYVYASLPSRLGADAGVNVPSIGFLAHVDTASEVTGANVNPQVIEAYDGSVITLINYPSQKLDPAESPALAKALGDTIVTTDGTTLLGADDKAGVAEIMTAVAYLLAHPDIKHGPLAFAFTPDEEIGRGTKYFDLDKFGAKYAYTLDGSDAGGIQYETFSADSAKITIRGRSQHPGYAKGRMVNGIKLAAEFVDRLPKGWLSPETTEHYEGYIHPVSIEGNVETVTINFILRDFENHKLLEYRELLQIIAHDVNRLDDRARIEIDFSESYRNMRDDLNAVPHVVAYAQDAIRRVGLTPFSQPVRGGTDGSRLTAMGLPTPNLFTGGHDYHSRREWANVDEMVQAVEMVVALAEVWAERGE